jgi:4-amino-4-deoxy-L-arabinose transferase-like glycosyltransferase
MDVHRRSIDADSSRYSPLRDVAAVVFVIVAVSFLFGARLNRLPIVGEESRWASAAREMLASGDWIVPRQQGQVFPERPPMTMWGMAVAGWLRGGVDPLAVRLPSVVAIVLTSLLVYGYARTLVSRFAGLAAALIFATFGQVLQIGRLGESEAVFALFVSASLLLWHLGYTRGWPQLATWSIGFGFAALAALVKGPQAPIYFVAITAAYLVLVRRDWRFLVSWRFAAGATLFAAIIAAWQVPYFLAAGWDASVATWTGLTADRVRLGGLAKHMATYPLETFACLLPWSPLLVALLKRDTRRLLAEQLPIVSFLVTAVAVAYPTVWIVAGARGRYFMPLYPLVAVLIALIIERCAAAEIGRYPRRAWHQFLLLSGSLIAASGLAFGIAGLLPTDWADQLYQPRWFCVILGVAAATAVAVLWTCYRKPHRLAPAAAVLAVATFAGLAYTGLMVNVYAARWNDPTQLVGQFKSHVADPTTLVSLSPIDHRFAYYYETPITEISWPKSVDGLPPDVDYFCFMRNPGDKAASRRAGRGRTWATTPGTLPFAWEEIASICVERRFRDGPQRSVILGRVTRPIVAVVSDATVPQTSTAKRTLVERR